MRVARCSGAVDFSGTNWLVSNVWIQHVTSSFWCAEVNGVTHSEICAVPAERLVTERELLAPLPSLRASIGKMVTRKVDRLSCVRFASARYSVPVALIGTRVAVRVDDGRLLAVVAATGEVVAEHMLVAPGEASVRDEHYGGPRPDTPRRRLCRSIPGR